MRGHPVTHPAATAPHPGQRPAPHPRRPRSTLLLLALSLVAGTLLTVWTLRHHPQQPRFEGRTARYWYPRWVWGPGQRTTADQRLQALLGSGPEAIPVVFEILRLPQDRLSVALSSKLARLFPANPDLTPRYRDPTRYRWSINQCLVGFLNTDDGFRALTNQGPRLPLDTRLALSRALRYHPRNPDLALPFLLRLAREPVGHDDALEAAMAFLVHTHPTHPDLPLVLESVNRIPVHAWDFNQAQLLGRQLLRLGRPAAASEPGMRSWLTQTNIPHLRPVGATVLAGTLPDTYPVDIAFAPLLPWRSGLPIRTLAHLSRRATAPPHPQRQSVAALLAPLLDLATAEQVAALERQGPRFTRDAYAVPIVKSVLQWFAADPDLATTAHPWLPPLFLHPDPKVVDAARQLWHHTQSDCAPEPPPWSTPVSDSAPLHAPVRPAPAPSNTRLDQH